MAKHTLKTLNTLHSFMGSGEQNLVVAHDLGKRYGDFIALHPLNVKVSSGEFLESLAQMERVNRPSSNC